MNISAIPHVSTGKPLVTLIINRLIYRILPRGQLIHNQLIPVHPSADGRAVDGVLDERVSGRIAGVIVAAKRDLLGEDGRGCHTICRTRAVPRLDFIAEISGIACFECVSADAGTDNAGNFTRVPEDEAGRAMYAMPMFPEEIIIPPLDGKPAEDYASSFAYTSDDPAYIPDLRGVKLGDSLMSVMSRFMCEPEKLAVIEHTYGGDKYALVYGTYTYWANDCRIIYENGIPAAIIYVCQVDMWIQFYLDENQCVRAVSYVEPW